MMSWFVLATVFIVFFNALLVPGETLASITTPWFTVSVTVDGLISGAAMSMRLLAVIGAFLVLVFTTHPNDLAEGLRRFGLPGWVCFVIGTAFRFVPSVAGDFRMVQDAQLSRGLRTGRGFISMAKSTVPLLVPAFALSIRRSQLLAEALESRGYAPGGTRTTLYPLRMKFVDACILFSCLAAVSTGAAVRILCS